MVFGFLPPFPLHLFLCTFSFPFSIPTFSIPTFSFP